MDDGFLTLHRRQIAIKKYVHNALQFSFLLIYSAHFDPDSAHLPALHHIHCLVLNLSQRNL